MFKHGLRENLENEVPDKDVDGEMIDKMLEYIYTGGVDKDISHFADRLLVAADKYDLLELKSLCQDTLLGNLITANAWYFLILAGMHGADKRKAAAIDVVLKMHGNKITVTAAWMDLLENMGCVIRLLPT